MTIDVTDATFERDVLDRSVEHPVVVDLWAPWCGPCKTLGPILEKVVGETEGAIELVKINIDDNPQASAAFKVQSIPAVFALFDRKVVDGFVGAVPETTVREFVGRLAPSPTKADELVSIGDETSLRRALELEPDHAGAVSGLASLLIEQAKNDEALALLARIPETPDTRHLAALARLNAQGDGGVAVAFGEIEQRLDQLLELVKSDEQARQEYLDILEALELEDPRRATYRRALSSRLF